MVTDVYFVYNDDSHVRQIGGAYTLKVSPFFHFIDDRTPCGKKDSYKLKVEWGSRMTPFILCLEQERPVKAFYSETGEDIVRALIQFLNGQENVKQ